MTLTELQTLNEARAELRTLRGKLTEATIALQVLRQENQNLRAEKAQYLPSPFECFQARVFIDTRGILVRVPVK